MDEHRILELDTRAVEMVAKYPNRRFLYDQIARGNGRPFIALIGPRGVGKTVLLRQLRSEKPDSLYVSADTLDSNDSLTALVQLFHDRYRIKAFLIDEIHFLPNFARDLKELYDFIPVEVWFTSSAALSLYASAWDLSRRVEILPLHPMSFREYLALARTIELAPLGIEESLQGA